MITTITVGSVAVKRGHAVKMSGTTVIPVTSASDTVVGIALQDVGIGKPVAIQMGGKVKIALQNNPAIAQENTVQVVGADDGLYRIVLAGTDVDFTASTNSIEQIRDGLIAAALVLDLDDDFTITAVSTDEISIKSKTAGTAFTITVTNANTNLVLTTDQAAVASVAFPKGSWGTFNSDAIGVPDTDGKFKSLEDAPATASGFALVLCDLFPAEVAG